MQLNWSVIERNAFQFINIDTFHTQVSVNSAEMRLLSLFECSKCAHYPLAGSHVEHQLSVRFVGSGVASF